MLVYDQTVPDASYLEHASLGLVLEHEKVAFEADLDFVRARPGGMPHADWPESQPDLIMLIDAYGVYIGDSGTVSDEGTQRVSERFGRDDAEVVGGWVEAGSWL